VRRSGEKRRRRSSRKHGRSRAAGRRRRWRRQNLAPRAPANSAGAWRHRRGCIARRGVVAATGGAVTSGKTRAAARSARGRRDGLWRRKAEKRAEKWRLCGLCWAVVLARWRRRCMPFCRQENRRWASKAIGSNTGAALYVCAALRGAAPPAMAPLYLHAATRLRATSPHAFTSKIASALAFGSTGPLRCVAQKRRIWAHLDGMFALPRWLF